MKIKFVKDDDFVNYKKCSMFIGTPVCDWKCCKEAGLPCSICQNYPWSKNEVKNIADEVLIKRYFNDPLAEAIVFGGLEPMDTFDDLLHFIAKFRQETDDDIIIYTGYNKEEVADKIAALSSFSNIIIKFGRYIPNSKSRYDEVLGVTLASKNQYAEKIS